MSEPGSEFDAFLLLSFGGPEAPEHVMPFLENVTRGRGVPKERLLEVAKHYEHLGGVSPINAQNRALLDAVGEALRLSGRPLPLYFGNRNWHPLLADTLRTMRDDGVKRAVVYVTSAYRSYSGCRQYIEDIERAVREVQSRDEVGGVKQTRDEVGGVKQTRDEVGGVPTTAPQLVKLPPFSEHPRFIAACAARLHEARAAYAEQTSAERAEHARIVFTAHSIPSAMAATCAYEADLRRAAERTIASACPGAAWDLVYQSRSGPPSVPWLEPDILDHLRALAASGAQDVIVAPIGFLTDHVEVIWDLDHEAKELAESLGLGFYRSATVGTHPELVAMIAELVQAAAQAAPAPCAATCCAYTPRRPQ